MVIIYALLSSVSFGAADFLGGFSSRKNAVTTAVLWTQFIGLVTAFIAISFFSQSHNVEAADIIWGLLSGISGVGGLVLLYKGLSCGIASIVSPATAVTGAVFPVLFGLVTGERPPLLTWTGIILSIPAIILLSRENTNNKEKKDHIIRSIRYGLGSGIFFGGFFILLSQTSETSGLWPLVFAKFGNIIIILLILLLRKDKFKLQSGTRRITLLSGFIDMMGNIFFLFASRTGYLILAVVLSALYPAPTVILQRIFLHENLTHLRIAGIILSITGAALIGIGG